VLTAKWPRLAGFAAESVTTFPSGVISAIAMFVKSQNAASTQKCFTVPSATKNSALNVIKIGSAVERATWYSASSARTIGCIASNANIHFVSTARICSSVASATSHSATTAKILSTVTSVKRYSASIAKLPSIAANANRSSVLVAESRSLVAMNARISFAPSGAKRYECCRAEDGTLSSEDFY
jgi:hypothetical protein